MLTALAILAVLVLVIAGIGCVLLCFSGSLCKWSAGFSGLQGMSQVVGMLCELIVRINS